jgi:catechol 2,3-dioxygenase-like lactoylglutathione lyase family enzyme
MVPAPGSAWHPQFTASSAGKYVGVGVDVAGILSATKETAMFDHLGIGVTNLIDSRTFYLKALEPLGVTVAMEGPYGVGMGQNQKPMLWLSETKERPAHLHLAFAAGSRTQVDEFYRAALAAGGKDNGPPGLRPHYHPDYYGAFVIGPDGHNVEAVCHGKDP